MTASLAERIKDCGFFDEAYYVSCYREEIPDPLDPLQHFLSTGLARGYKPNSGYDPLAERLRHPDLDAETALLRALASPPLPPPADHGKVMPLLKGIKRLPTVFGQKDFATDDAEDIAHARRYGAEGETALSVDGRTYRLHMPPAKWLFARLQNDQPFAMGRITHGDWDCVHAYNHYLPLISAAVAEYGFSGPQLELLTARYCDEAHRKMQIFEEHFMTEFFADLTRHIRHPDFFHAVAFKGYPTADERLFEWSAVPKPGDLERLRIFASYFAPDEQLFDAMMWKRWIISGDIGDLPFHARQRPVIFMGAERLVSLAARWSLPWMLHIPIPPEFGYRLRHQLLQSCLENIAEANDLARRHGTKRPVFLMQGSSFAYWFMARLFPRHPDIFYIDLGQALHPWFYDIRDIGLSRWGELYGRTIIANCGLEDYYRELGVADPVAENLFTARRK